MTGSRAFEAIAGARRARRAVVVTARHLYTAPQPSVTTEIPIAHRDVILHVGPVPPPIEGGISVYLEGLLRSELATRFDLRTLDVTLGARLRRHRVLRAGRSVRFFQLLRRALRRDRPRLVHIHTSGSFGFWEKALFGAMAHSRHVPYVMHLHGGDFDVFLQRLGPALAGWARRSLDAAAAVITPASGWLPLLERFARPERLAVVPNAIHVADFAPAPRSTPGAGARLLFLGMVSARKGLDELAQALLELVRSGCTRFEVHIAGGEEIPGELERLRSVYRVPGLRERVRFHGPLFGADKLRLLQSADVFVLPSRNESFGIANLEAMACGLPLVSTRTGAIPEYLDDGENGLLVPPGDVRALTDALRRVIEDPGLRLRLGQEGRRRVRAYDWTQAAGRLAEIYARCLSPSAPAASGAPV